jgi:hypothetical protein
VHSQIRDNLNKSKYATNQKNIKNKNIYNTFFLQHTPPSSASSRPPHNTNKNLFYFKQVLFHPGQVIKDPPKKRGKITTFMSCHPKKRKKAGIK